jgi:hypothetical protein
MKVFVLWAAPPGDPVPPTGEAAHRLGAQPAATACRGDGGRQETAAGRETAGPARPQPSALIFAARSKSAAVRPPAECVDNVSVTLFHSIRMSGW